MTFQSLGNSVYSLGRITQETVQYGLSTTLYLLLPSRFQKLFLDHDSSLRHPSELNVDQIADLFLVSENTIVLSFWSLVITLLDPFSSQLLVLSRN